ncbi:MAG: carboxypeptidase regulatory-like domain-containing protein [Bryobacteraceae bacterium]
MTGKSVLLATVLAAALSSAAFGQASAINGQILGTITDASGAAVGGAKVTALNVNTGFQQSADTESTGFYRINVLPLGRYEVHVDASGFAPLKQTGIEVTAGGTVTLSVRLEVKGVSTEVVVNGSSAVIDPSRTDTGRSLGSYVLSNLPLVSRNPYNFILQQPNVTGRGNTEFGVPRKVNANGFNGRINYQLDGSNNTESDRAGIRLLPISNEWIEEVQTVSNGFAPEFGNTVGTVFNTITKSGSNEYHGQGGYIFRRTPFSARPALLAEGRPTPDVNVNAYNASVGGRIIQDKLFFFGSYERVVRDLPTTVSPTPAVVAQLGLPANYADAIPFKQKVTFFLAKADWQLNASNRVSIRYNLHRNDSPFNNGGGLTLISQTYNFVDRSHAGAVQLVSTLSPNAVNELRVQIPNRAQAQNSFEANVPGPSITVSGVANFGNSPNTGFLYQERTPEVTENFSYNLNQHSLKFGTSLRWIRDIQTQAVSATYNFPSIAAYLAAVSGAAPKGYSTFVQMVGEPSLSYNSRYAGFYGQDSWKPRANVTITYGVRYDVFSPPPANASSPLASSKSFRTDKNNFAPRLGAAIGLGKWVVRASSGIFYDPFQTDQYRKSILQNGSPTFYTVNVPPTQPFAPSFPNVFSGSPTGFTLPTQDILTVSPDFASLYSINGNVSVSRELGANSGVTATYLYTRGNRLPIWSNLNLIRNGGTLADGRPTFGTGRINPAYNNIITAESVGTSVYNGLNLSFTKRFGHGVDAFATWTWSHSIDDAPEQNNIDSASAYLSDVTNRSRDRGNSLTDRRHAFNANAVWDTSTQLSSKPLTYLLSNNRIALLFNAQSGENFNMGSNRVLNGDTSTGTAFQRPLYVGRNTLRAPSTYELNMRYSRIFPIGERWKPEFFFESTNILNHTNVTGINATASVDTLGAIIAPPSQAWTSALDQRLIQFGLKLSF